jgi:hypothetical protein
MTKCLGFLVAIAALYAQAAGSDPSGVLSRFAINRLTGSRAVAIQALTSDAAGNVYVAAATAAAVRVILRKQIQP